AEDGIRDATVTGVQTCALPIYRRVKLSVRTHDVVQRGVDIDKRHVIPEVSKAIVSKGNVRSVHDSRRFDFNLDVEAAGDRPQPQIGRASCREREEKPGWTVSAA